MATQDIASQTTTAYENYKKLKTLVDVGYFLEDYVISGGVVTKDVTYNNTINVTEIVASLDNDVTRRDAVSFKTTVASTTYYLDYTAAGDFNFDTAHFSGSYLPVAQVTTDANKNVLAIPDMRGDIGGLRLDPDYMIPEITALQANDVTGFTRIQGIEYLWRYHTLIRDNQPTKIIFSGDSTTQGHNIVNPNYYIDKLAKSFLDSVGKPYATTINAGYGGKLSADWLDTYLAEDLAQNPDLYVLRWGLNDATNPEETNLETFKQNMEEGLATLRASTSTATMSIILMTPSTALNRVEFVKSTIPILKDLAREYECGFVDTFSFMQDPNAVWMDADQLHPTDTASFWTATLLSELLCPTSMRKGTVLNIPASTIQKVATDTPSTYEKGISMHFAGTGFPFEGLVSTTRTEDSVLLQMNTSYLTGIDNGVAFRRGYANTGISGTLDNTWGAWVKLTTIVKQSLTLQNDWVQYSSDFSDIGYYKDNDGFVHLAGVLKDGVMDQFTAITSALPSGYRPAKNSIFKNDTIVVTNAGVVMSWAITDNTLVSLDGIVFKAEQ